MSSAPEPAPAPLAERIAAHQRAVVVALVALTALAWAWLASRPMDMAPSLIAVTMMWSAMMAAMMLPSAAPAVLLFGRVAGRQQAMVGTSAQFVLGYLIAWTGFSLVAATVQVIASRSGMIDPMSLSTDGRIAGALWLAAGLYQWTPLKRTCLRQCRSPASFFARHWRPGPAAALRLGLRHGLFCIGCCAALMTLLFVGGAMNLTWAAALAAVVAVEKIVPRGDAIGRAAGAAMIAWGALAFLA